MYGCNDLSPITSLPVAKVGFRCGWWGKHRPPFIQNDTIKFAVGEGYRSSKHLHGQNVYVLDVDNEARIALVEMRKYGDLYGAGHWAYLMGIEDEHLWVCHVPVTLETIHTALEYLKPVEVKRAKTAGLSVVRQGDWYFIPVEKPGRGETFTGAALDDDHVATEFVRSKTAVWVMGNVTHDEHPAIHLDSWHKAVRNKALRTGRFALGGDAD